MKNNEPNNSLMFRIAQYVLQGKLFTPFVVGITVFFVYLLFFHIEANSTKYNKRRITIPMKNFIVPPAPKPKAVKTKKTVSQEEKNDMPDQVDLVSLKRLYLTNMVHLINRAKKYPIYELRNNKEGVVKVKLIINKNGTIRALKILQSSRFSAFNAEAKAAIYRAAPFGKFPQLLPDEEISVIFNIVFRLS